MRSVAQETGTSTTFDELKTLEQGDRLRTLYIVATCILAAIVPIILFVGLWVWSELFKAQRGIEQQMIFRAVQLSRQVDTKVLEQFSILQAIASLPSLEDANFVDFREDALKMKGAMPQWRGIFLYDAASGKLILDTAGGDNTTSPSKDIQAVVAKVAETRKPAVCTCHILAPEEDIRNGVMIFVPVPHMDGIRYVLAATLRMDVIQVISNMAAEDEFPTALFDEKSRILARSRGIEGYFGELPSEDYRRGVAESDVAVFSATTLDGTLDRSAMRRSALTNWVAIVGVDQGSLEKISIRSVWTIGVTAGLSIALAAVLAIVLVYNIILRRIVSERMAASRAVGDLQSKLLSTTQEALEDQSKAASEREVLLRELYHRVKNNLQIIQSLLRLGARNLSPEQREPFETAVRRIGAMARVHTLLYNSPDLASIDFKDYLKSIVAETSEGFGADARGIKTHVDAETMRVPLDTAIPVAFVSVELLANAYKHAFPEGRNGRIDIVVRKHGDSAVLTISDNGIGMPPHANSRSPLGLNLVEKLIEQIGGTMQAPKAGESTYRITFPLAEKKPLPDEAG